MEERKLFESLNQSEIGKQLVEYCKTLQAKAADSRTWGPENTKEEAQRINDLIQVELIDKIQLQANKKTPEKNPFE